MTSGGDDIGLLRYCVKVALFLSLLDARIKRGSSYDSTMSYFLMTSKVKASELNSRYYYLRSTIAMVNICLIKGLRNLSGMKNFRSKGVGAEGKKIRR